MLVSHSLIRVFIFGCLFSIFVCLLFRVRFQELLFELEFGANAVVNKGGDDRVGNNTEIHSGLCSQDEFVAPTCVLEFGQSLEVAILLNAHPDGLKLEQPRASLFQNSLKFQALVVDVFWFCICKTKISFP